MPLRQDDRLRAWDSADEYLLQQCRENPAARSDHATLIVNDSFGALATALASVFPEQRITSWSDSHLGELALAHNLSLNGLPRDSVEFLPGDRDPAGPVDLVLMKFPKSMVWWEDLLLRLRPALTAETTIISGGMIKHSPARAFQLLETVLGPTKTSRGWKKARLAHTRFDPDLSLSPGLPPAVFDLEEFGLSLLGGSNVFSRGRLDLGTRVLLEYLPATDEPLKIADLGCGNGVLALALARNCPNAAILGLDESYQAVASARQNAVRAGLVGKGVGERLRFEVSAGLDPAEAESLDLVVCNPPFHQGQNRGDQIAWEMFVQAKRSLRPGGRLYVVGNRHLGYHLKLKRLFSSCESLAAHPKFVVLRASRFSDQ
ncbi:MAG: methyltransferase [Gemmatimonadales bacterium]|nr:methyltransferase [Gemmatimonadales bacterium]